MKKAFLSTFTIIFAIICGCEQSNDNNSLEELQINTTALKKVNTGSKQQAFSKHQTKTEKKQQPVKVRQKLGFKPPLPENEKKAEAKRSVETKKQQGLDLSLSLKMQELLISDNISNHEIRNFLPDLFVKQKKEKKLQINGKLIEKEEEETGKDRIVDGIEIDINLNE